MPLRFRSALLLVLAAHARRVAALNPGNGTLGTFSWDTTDFIFAFGDTELKLSFKGWIQQLAYHQDEKRRLLRNFAANGASIDNALVAISEHETGVAQQLPKFEQHFTPSPEFFHWESTNTLFSIFVGINDCDLSFHWEVDQTEWHAREFRTWTTLQERLYAVGARHFLFMTVPPMHASPGYWGEGKLKDSIEDYNLHLRMSAAAFQDAHPDAVVLLHDMYTTFGQLLDNAPLLGFKVTDAPCKSYAPTGTHPTLVAHPDCVYPLSEYFWKDSLHPSWPVHQLMAERVKGETLSVPEWVEGSQMRNILGGG
ncbi:hypothetical protein RQP46_000527 [Phenoliferia psychrophenolica]